MAISWLSRELGNFSREFFELTMPAIDMFEDEKDLIVKIDLAGFAKKDINLRKIFCISEQKENLMSTLFQLHLILKIT
jgi:hypothetical protein